MLALELQRGKEGMRLEQYYDTLGATAACTLQLMEEAQRDDDRTGADTDTAPVLHCISWQPRMQGLWQKATHTR